MIRVRKLRDLTLSNTVEGRPNHLTAGSGLVRRGDCIYVVGDDELDLAVFSLSSGEPGELVRLFEGVLPVDSGERSQDKPDLEALTVLPPFRFNPHGALLALGSGSGESRDRGFAWSLDESGALRGFPRIVDLSDLYDFLEQHVAGKLNIEGVAVTGDRLALFQRGNSKDGENLVAYLSLERVLKELSADFAIESSELDEVQKFELGDLGGIELNFSDADSLPDGRLVFAASTEAPDGECVGSVVGVIDSDHQIQRIEPLDDDSVKVEGVDAILSDEQIDVLLVSDADDVNVPSPLFSATLPG